MVCYSRPAVYAYVTKFRLDRFILSPSVGEKPNFCGVWTSTFSSVANWQQSEKVGHGCTTTNLSLSNSIKIFSVLQRLHGKIGRTNSDVQKRDEQTGQCDGRGIRLQLGRSARLICIIQPTGWMTGCMNQTCLIHTTVEQLVVQPVLQPVEGLYM